MTKKPEFTFKIILNRLFGNTSTASNKNNRKPGRSCRIEELESREMLSVTPWSLAGDMFATYNGEQPFDSDSAAVGNLPSAVSTAPTLTPLAAAPDGYNAHDLAKIEAANANNGLLDEHVTWTEIEGELRVTRIEAENVGLTGSLDLSGCSELTYLLCDFNFLTSLEVSNCEELKNINCQVNRLTALNVSGCTALQNLNCCENRLTSLDVSDCRMLDHLYCPGNQLTELNVSGCTALLDLSCHANQLTELNVSNNTALESLLCYSNQLSTLDVSQNTALTTLICAWNALMSLNITTNTALTYLQCNDNQLTVLDVSHNTTLTVLRCFGNKLTFSTLPLGNFYPDDDYYAPIYAPQMAIAITLGSGNIVDLSSEHLAGTTTYTWKRTDNGAVITPASSVGGVFTFGDSLAGVAVYCEMTNTGFPGLTLATTEVRVGGEPTYNAHDWDKVESQGLQDYATWSEVNGELRLVSIDNSGYSGGSLPITITSLDFSGCTALESLMLSNGGNPNLGDYLAEGGGLTSLDVTGCISLIDLNCGYNKLTELDVSTCTALTYLTCNFNQLAILDVSGCVALDHLECSVNQLSTLDISNNTALTTLTCWSNQLTELDISQHTALITLYYGSNPLPWLDISQHQNLQSLDVRELGLTELDISQNTSLSGFVCSGILFPLENSVHI